jgi:hypothetical protein
MLSCSKLHSSWIIFIQETHKFVRQETIYLKLHRANKSEATLGPSGCLRSEATLGPSVYLGSTPVITRPVVCFLQTEPRLQRSQILAFASSTPIITGIDRFASCKRYFGYNGAGYLPLQVQLRSSRDRSFCLMQTILRL